MTLNQTIVTIRMIYVLSVAVCFSLGGSNYDIVFTNSSGQHFGFAAPVALA